MKPMTRSEEWEAKTDLSFQNWCALIGFILVLDGVTFSFGERIGWRFVCLSLIAFGGWLSSRWLYWEYLRWKEGKADAQ